MIFGMYTAMTSRNDILSSRSAIDQWQALISRDEIVRILLGGFGFTFRPYDVTHFVHILLIYCNTIGIYSFITFPKRNRPNQEVLNLNDCFV